MAPIGILILILLVFGLVCLVIAAIWNPTPPAKVHFGWLGLVFWIAAELLTRFVSK